MTDNTTIPLLNSLFVCVFLLTFLVSSSPFLSFSFSFFFFCVCASLKHHLPPLQFPCYICVSHSAYICAYTHVSTHLVLSTNSRLQLYNTTLSSQPWDPGEDYTPIATWALLCCKVLFHLFISLLSFYLLIFAFVCYLTYPLIELPHHEVARYYLCAPSALGECLVVIIDNEYTVELNQLFNTFASSDARVFCPKCGRKQISFISSDGQWKTPLGGASC